MVMAIAQSRIGQSFLLVLALVGMLLCIAYGFTFTQVYKDISHAIEKHGEQGAVVSQACAKDPVMRLWVSERKFIDVCIVNGEIGFRVIKMIGGSLTAGNPRWGEVTAYIRNELKTLADVANYALSRGYKIEFFK